MAPGNSLAAPPCAKRVAMAAEEAEAAKAKSSTPIDRVHEDEDDAPSAFRKKEPA